MACFKKIGFTTTPLNDTNFRSIRWYLESIDFLLQWVFSAGSNGFTIDPVLEVSSSILAENKRTT